MASTGGEYPPQAAPAPPVPGAETVSEVRVYPHSPFIYFWVVWAYGYVCALLTRVQGEVFTIGGGKPLLIHPSPLLGISFVLLLLFVILATTARARGILAILLLGLLALAALATHFVMNVEWLYRTPPTILVHMNLAFYMLVSTVLLVLWLAVVFIIDGFTYWRFRGTQIEKVQRFASVLGRAPESYSAMHVKMTRYSDDLLAHKVLGLGILGLGTSDIDGRIAIFGGGNEQFRIEHVWRAGRSLQKIQTMMGPKATVVI